MTANFICKTAQIKSEGEICARRYHVAVTVSFTLSLFIQSVWLLFYLFSSYIGVKNPAETGPNSQALVYDILPSTTAVFSYAIGSRKLSANEQFFVGAQTVVSLLQTTQIKQCVSFIAANQVYTSTNKTTIVWIETELFLSPGMDASRVYVRALALGCFYTRISTRTFRKALTEIKIAPSVA